MGRNFLSAFWKTIFWVIILNLTWLRFSVYFVYWLLINFSLTPETNAMLYVKYIFKTSNWIQARNCFLKDILGKIIPNTIIYKRLIMQKEKQKGKQMC